MERKIGVLAVAVGTIMFATSRFLHPETASAQDKQFLVLCMREDQPIPHEFINPNTILIDNEEYPYRGGFAVVIRNSKNQSWVEYYQIFRDGSKGETREQLNENTRKLVESGGTAFRRGAFYLRTQEPFRISRSQFLGTVPTGCLEPLYGNA